MNKIAPFADEGENTVHVIIETPRGSRQKFAWEESVQAFSIKKTLPPGLSFPLSFGYIPGTKGGDGDPVDALVFMEGDGYPGVFVACRVIGMLPARQEKEGKMVRNDRVLAVAATSYEYQSFTNLGDVPEAMIDSINSFFKQYHAAEGTEYLPLEAQDAAAALEAIRAAIV